MDLTIANLKQYMEVRRYCIPNPHGLLTFISQPGDIIIDGGNEWFPNSVRRSKELEEDGIHFVGMGVSGGEEGARYGPSLMPGGPKEAYTALEPILTKIAAQVDDGPCVTYIGEIGAGNYVKVGEVPQILTE